MLKGCLYTVSGWNDGEWSGEPAVDPKDASGLIVGLSGKFDGVEMWGDPAGDRKAEYTTVEYTDESIYAGTYTFELADFKLAANDKFKVRIDGGWIGSGNATITGINLGSTDGDGNFIVTESGTYNVTFTFSWDGGNYSNVRVKFEKQGGTEPEVPAPTTKTIYLKPGIWTTANAKFEAWTWGGASADSWVVFKKLSNEIYYVEIPLDRTGMKILRKDPNSASNAWVSWNDSGDQAIPSDKNMFVVKDWNSYSWEVYK